MRGIIDRVWLARGFGFIKDSSGVDYFLHVNDLPEGIWDGDHIKKGVAIQFTPVTTDKGLRATEASLC